MNGISKYTAFKYYYHGHIPKVVHFLKKLTKFEGLYLYRIKADINYSGSQVFFGGTTP